MGESEGFVNVRSISRFCECESCVLYRSGVILCCVLWGGGGGLRSGL